MISHIWVLIPSRQRLLPFETAKTLSKTIGLDHVLISQGISSIARARNHLLQQYHEMKNRTEHDLILWIDDDIVIHDESVIIEALETLKDMEDKHKTRSVVVVPYLINANQWSVLGFGGHALFWEEIQHFRMVESSGLGFALMQASLLHNITFISNELGEDIIFTRDVTKSGEASIIMIPNKNRVGHLKTIELI